MYSRPSPKRKPKTVAEIREEAAAKLREGRNRNKEAAETRSRRDTFSGSHNVMPGSANGTRRRGSIPLPTATGTSDQEPPDQNNEEEAAPTMDPAQIAFFTAMEKRLTASSKEAAEGLSSLLQRNITRIDNNAKNIQDLKERDERFEERLVNKMEERDRRRELEMESRLVNLIDEKIGKALDGVTGKTTTPVSGRREEEYDFCRRTLRLWQISSKNTSAAVISFLEEKLKFDKAAIEKLGKISTKVVSVRPDAAIQEVVLATFETKEARDEVKSHGRHLAGVKGAGMNIHVPGFLLDSLHALNSVGYSIKEKHSGVKRAIKFDDQRMDLFMDIYVGGDWKRISAKEAREVAKEIPTKEGGMKLTKADISGLVRGDPVAGVTAVVVPPEE